MKRLVAFVLAAGWLASLPAQNSDWIPGHDAYHYVDRLDVLGYLPYGIPTSLKPYGRERVEQWLNDANTTRMRSSELHWHERIRIQAIDSVADAAQARGLWGVFGTNHRDLYSTRSDRFRLYVNPVLYLTAGLDRNNDPASAESSLPIFNNLRGLVLRGSIGEKLGFHVEAGDYLARIPEFRYRNFRTYGSIPGEEEIKAYGSVNGVNYFKTRGYLTASPARWLRVKLGKDRAQWGNGWQSLWLSDHAADAFLLNLHVSIWKFEYMSHFAQYIDYFPAKSDPAGDFPRKYGAFHTLLFRPVPNVSVGVFESVMYAANQPNGRRGFELQYLNPLIFYRAAEQLIGSPDNGLLGLNFKANLFNTVQLYGQGVLDDYNFSNRTQGPGYWGNQWGLQGGLKYYNAFTIPTLDLQLEYNRVRPYVYQHYTVVTNYTQYGESLGHAAGANLQDVHVMLRYHPLPAWNLQLVASQLVQGKNQDGKNYGWDPRTTYNGRPFEYGHTAGQGNPWTVRQVWGRLSWQFGSSEVYLEAEGRYRWEQLGTATPVQSLSAFAGIRVAAVPEQIRW